MGLLLAISSAFTVGAADFFGGIATKRAPVWTVVFWSNLVGLGTALVGVATFSGDFSPVDVLWGGLAGICGSAGALCLYQALATGAMSVAAPVAAATGAVFPVVAGLLDGDSLRTLAVGGLVCGLVAIPLVSLGPASKGPWRKSLALAVAAGLGAGAFLVLVSNTGHGNTL